MKKILLLSALLCLGGAIPAIADDDSSGFTTLDRSGWTITPSSEELYGEDSPNGPALNIIDSDMSTFWHSSYNNKDTDYTANAWGESNPHFFIIDMGSEQQFNTVKFSPRNPTNSTQNGLIQSYKLYVSNEAFGITAGNANTRADIQASYNTYAADHTPILSDDVTFDGSTTYSFFLSEPTTARYILFVMNGYGSYANCADFQLGTTTDEAKNALSESDAAALSTYKADAIAKVEAVYSLVPALFRQSDYESTKSAINDVSYTLGKLSAAKTTVDNACYSFFDYAGHQVVTIANVRRTASVNGVPQYLYADAEQKTINTTGTLTEYAKWELIHVSGTEYFKLHNVGVDGYVSGSENSKANADASGACQVRFIENTSVDESGVSYAGIALQFLGSDKGFNVNTQDYHSDLVSWDYNDCGSSWAVKLASVEASALQASTDESKTYYKIRSNRGLTGSTAQGSLLGIDGGAGSQDINQDYARMAKASELGTYWYLVKNGEGYELHNLISDYNVDGSTVNYGLTTPDEVNAYSNGYAKRYAWMTGTPTIYYVIPATNYGTYTGHHATAVALSNQSTAGGSGTCIDVASYTGNDNNLNYRHAVANEWYPQGGDSDNGSTFYFELADNDDVEAAKTAYLAAITPVTTNPFDALDGCPEALLSAAEIAESKAEVADELATIPADVASANAKYKSGVEYSDEWKSAANEKLAAAYDACIAKMDGKEVNFASINKRNNSTYYIGVKVADNGSYILTPTSSAGLGEIWTLEQVDGMKFKFYNLKNDLYWGLTEAQYTSVAAVSADNAETFELLIGSTSGEVAFADTSSIPGLHLDGSNQVVKWYNNDEGNESWWAALSVETTATGENPKEATITSVRPSEGSTSATIAITYEGATSVTLTDGAENFVINVTAKSTTSSDDGSEVASAPRRRASAVVSTSDGTGEVTVDGNTATFTLDGVENGDYDVTVPTGFFTVDGVLSAPIAQTITIDGTTMLTEVTADGAVAADAIYDLQGRRVSSMARPGIYIVNGRKVKK
jgi:hypothetical protein